VNGEWQIWVESLYGSTPLTGLSTAGQNRSFRQLQPADLRLLQTRAIKEAPTSNDKKVKLWQHLETLSQGQQKFHGQTNLKRPK